MKNTEKDLRDIAKYLSVNEEEFINEIVPVIEGLLKAEREKIVEAVRLENRFFTYATDHSGVEERWKRKGYNQAVDELNNKIEKLC